MFDDYDYKDTSKRISAKFAQERDEPMYPWEIAGFLNKFNTVYYKFELLNSISSALQHGIKPQDIFIFDKSLPLYERYSEMNLINEPQAAKLFYPIGLPTPLVPDDGIYKYSFLYQYFHEINSFLRSNHIQPLRLINLSAAYEELQNFDLDAAEEYVFNLAIRAAQRSYEAAAKRGEKKSQFTTDDLGKALAKYKKRKAQLFEDIAKIQRLDSDELLDVLTLGGRENKRLSALVDAFFTNFHKTARPLVCARVGENKFRVLGRSLVNKRERTGLEVKEVRRNSPLSALLEGGIAFCQVVLNEKRAKELHGFDLQIKEAQLEQARAAAQEQQLKRLSAELQVREQLASLAQRTDIGAAVALPNSHTKNQLMKAYGIQFSEAAYALNNQGLMLEPESLRMIDVSA